MSQRSRSMLCAVSLVLIAGTATAQTNPELGDVGGQAQVQGSFSAPPPAVQPSAAPPEPAASTSDPIETASTSGFAGSDHAQFIGRFGVGLFGVLSVPVGGGGADGDNTVSTPTLGGRYWLQERMGIEAGLGFGYESSGSETSNGTTTVETDGPSVFGIALHGGVPFVFAAAGHFAFQVIPELNLGFATGGQGDVDVSGFLLELGARAGAEIHFGFIDIPQLALQATIGLHLRYESRSQSEGDNEFSSSAFRFGTTLQGEPWDIFQGNIAAIYYF
jgi:hypothetical protein